MGLGRVHTSAEDQKSGKGNFKLVKYDTLGFPTCHKMKLTYSSRMSVFDELGIIIIIKSAFLINSTSEHDESDPHQTGLAHRNQPPTCQLPRSIPLCGSETKANVVLFWAGTRPPFMFCVNPFSVFFVLILLTNQQTDTGEYTTFLLELVTPFSLFTSVLCVLWCIYFGIPSQHNTSNRLEKLGAVFSWKGLDETTARYRSSTKQQNCDHRVTLSS